ncbi:TIGR04141 family sporadically distributed protein [Treponema primitia]|uniref:DUF6119 family protein n=1 Tax=Treponema primitia TaxID=88058 RepID=UPI003980CB85
MGNINIYKIDVAKQRDFEDEVSKYQQIGNQGIIRKIENNNVIFNFVCYIENKRQKKDVEWNWLPIVFNYKGDVKSVASPKAVLAIEYSGELYAITFGYSFFTVDKYCDRNFGFNFARKIKYKEIKTTTLTSPNSNRNKTVNTYINYNELEFDSGESYAKLKAKADIPDSFNLFKPSLEIGNSIKFSIEHDSLNSIIDLILYIESAVSMLPDLYKIPVFSKISSKDSVLIESLNNQLRMDIQKNPTKINISELDIIGATEIFNHNDGVFTLRYEMHKKKVSLLTKEELNLFCRDNKLKPKDVLLDISVVSYKEGVSIRTDKIKNIIDYTNDVEKCILSKGVWYKYNNDYLQYLKESIREVQVVYNSTYDFSGADHQAYIQKQCSLENVLPEYKGKTDDEIKVLITRKYYAERCFNLLREENDGFKNFDRIETRYGSADIELMDLYKEKTMFAVKIGNTSAKLCYVVDQSLTSLKMYKHQLLPRMPEINNVALWIVLERKKHLSSLSNGNIDIDELDMLMLKNRIDQWKKEVRISGYVPIIYINYRT